MAAHKEEFDARGLVQEFRSLLQEVKTLSQDLKNMARASGELKHTLAIQSEQISNIDQTTSDISRKFDALVVMQGCGVPVSAKKPPPAKGRKGKEADVDDTGDVDGDIGGERKTADKPAAAAKAAPKASKKKKYHNVMAFFRAKYMADPTFLNGVISTKECEALFEEHEKVLKPKKGEKKLVAQIGVLYKSINKNKEKIEVIRAMMEKENAEYAKETGAVAGKDQTDDEADDAAAGTDSECD